MMFRKRLDRRIGAGHRRNDLHVLLLIEQELPSRPKVIFCTTENGVGHIRAAIEAGADEYVMKPFDRETLESKLQMVGL